MTEKISSTEKLYWLRVAGPQILTGSRVALGAAAMICITSGQSYWSASLITLGLVTDIFDGFLARRLGTASPRGALFDTFTDYLCFVVAPWFLTRAIVGAEGNIWLEVLVGIPLLTGALRYARNSIIVASESEEIRELPGLATVFFAFLPVAAVFLDAKALVNETLLTVILVFFVLGLSGLMVSTVSYPKLTSIRILIIPVTVMLVAMPFVGTQFLALVMVIAGLLYVALGPFVLVRRSGQNDRSR